MDYNGYFSDALARLQSERRYRVFADLERIADRFPHAVWHSPPYYAYGCYGYCAQNLPIAPRPRVWRANDPQ